MLVSMESPPNRLLLVEDDDSICRQLTLAMMDSDFTLDVAGNLWEARTKVANGYHLILLDLGLPDGDGLHLCRDLREMGDPTPVIVLTARHEPEQRVRGLEAGADDYLSKPFHVPELIARIRAVLRRTQPDSDSRRLHLGDLWLDPSKRKAGKGEKLLDLKPREYELLHFFLRHPGRTWTRAQLLTWVWGIDFYGETRTVDLHVGRLRAFIENDPKRPKLLQTVWGVGYRFAEEDSHDAR
ncbi:MAG: DNA-binding response regulator [Planctomycetota bacterium]|nr:MAG: DNA-binding response regulator [Planctomycetota bacterium]